MHRNPLVSVVVPYFQQPHFLRSTIESVMRQTYPHFELVVVDDGSADETAGVVADYPAVKLVRQANQGTSAARNRGLRESAGEFVVFLDADDLLVPEALSVGVEALRAHPEAAFVYGYGRFIDEAGDPMPTPPQLKVTKNHYERLFEVNYIWSVGGVMFRRPYVDEFRVGMDGCADWDLYLRVTKNHPVHCHHQTVYLYRRHGLNLSSQSELMYRHALAVFRDQLEVVRGDRRLEKLCRQHIRFRERWLAGHPHYHGGLLSQIRQRLRIRTRARALAKIFKRNQ